MVTIADFDPWEADISMANAAVFETRAAGTGFHRLLTFVDTGTREAWFTGKMPEGYGGEDINIRIEAMAASATSGAVVFDGAIERHQRGTDDLDTDSLGTLVTATSGTFTTPNGEEQQTVILLNTAGELDSIAAGEKFRIRIRRQPGNASDTLGEDCQVTWVSMDTD